MPRYSDCSAMAFLLRLIRVGQGSRKAVCQGFRARYVMEQSRREYLQDEVLVAGFQGMLDGNSHLVRHPTTFLKCLFVSGVVCLVPFKLLQMRCHVRVVALQPLQFARAARYQEIATTAALNEHRTWFNIIYIMRSSVWVGVRRPYSPVYDHAKCLILQRKVLNFHIKYLI
jgi:hypothetical protein